MKSKSSLISSTTPIRYESLSELHEDDDNFHSSISSQSTCELSSYNKITDDFIIFQIQTFNFYFYNLKYITYVIIGISLLWPWNCFLSASQYFMMKFSKNTSLSNIYTSTMMTVSTLSSLLFNSYISTLQIGSNYTRRVIFGILSNLLIFGLLTLIEYSYPELSTIEYFCFLMFLVLFSSIGTCLQQNGTMAIVNIMGSQYAQGLMVGQAIAGVLPSIALIISNLSTDKGNGKNDQNGDSSKSIVIYFGMTCLVMIISGLLFCWINHLENVNDLLHRQNTNEQVQEEEPNNNSNKEQGYIPFFQLFHKLKYIVLSIFTIFVITLIFPIFAANISSIHATTGTSVVFQDVIFIPFIFLIWNIGDLTGRMLCSFPRLVINSDRKMFQYSLARSLIIPLFFLCNLSKTEDDSSPIINSDFFYIFIQFIFGLTNGHCLSCCFMNVANYVDSDDEKKAAGGFSTIFLSLGLLFGSLVSYFFVNLVK